MARIRSQIPFKIDFSFLLIFVFTFSGFIFLNGGSDCYLDMTDSGKMQTSQVENDCCDMVIPAESNDDKKSMDCSSGSICCYAQNLSQVADNAIHTIQKTNFNAPAKIFSDLTGIQKVLPLPAPDIVIVLNIPIYLKNSSFLN